MPSSRSILVGCGIAVAAIGAYALARETSAFAVRSVEVSGAPPDVAAQVRHALAPLLGTSLVGLDGGRLERTVEALPTVVSAGYDRAFPHTLRVVVVPERPVAVVRRGAQAWLVSARARIVREVARDADAALPRIWLPAATALSAGGYLESRQGGDAARALAFAGSFPERIRSAARTAAGLVFHLRSGLDLRLGDPGDMRLKLAVARRALRQLPAGTTYLDVGLPGRPVAGADAATASLNSQLSTGG